MAHAPANIAGTLIARTSTSHPLRIASLAAGDGLIGITFCPGKKQHSALSGAWNRDLETDVAAIAAWGATHVVTLLERQEFDELRVAALQSAIRAAGMHWHHLPIPDGQPPGRAFELRWPVVRPRLVSDLAAGARVLVHCKGGLGRAGTVAARLLLAARAELGADTAIALIRQARPGAIENRAQEDHVRALRVPARHPLR